MCEVENRIRINLNHGAIVKASESEGVSRQQSQNDEIPIQTGSDDSSQRIETQNQGEPEIVQTEKKKEAGPYLVALPVMFESVLSTFESLVHT